VDQSLNGQGGESPGASGSLSELAMRLRRFADERDWNRFHSPKNLAMALVAEAGELVEQFQWLTESESAALTPERLAAVQHELADVLIYLVRLGDVLGVDLLAAAGDKIALNEARYPAERVRGQARKHDEV
jgi:NTP pyrophosphatase (non-canonical NTP hydrolase)